MKHVYLRNVVETNSFRNMRLKPCYRELKMQNKFNLNCIALLDKNLRTVKVKKDRRDLQEGKVSHHITEQDNLS